MFEMLNRKLRKVEYKLYKYKKRLFSIVFSIDEYKFSIFFSSIFKLIFFNVFIAETLSSRF